MRSLSLSQKDQSVTLSNDVRRAIEKNRDEAKNLKNQIEGYAQTLLGAEDGEEDDNSLKVKIDSLHHTFKQQQGEINAFHKQLTEGDGNKTALMEQIEEAQTEAINNSEAIKGLWDDSNKNVGQINQFRGKIFGTIDGEGKLVTLGLAKEFAKQREDFAKQQGDFDDFSKEQESVLAALKTQIEALLPGATSAGLASAFKERKNNAATKAGWYGFAFFLILFTLSGLGLTQFEGLTTLEQWVSKAPYYLSVLMPLLWLGLFLSKRRSENARLEQEYAHKEALAKSYDSYKAQIDKLKETDETLLVQLMQIAIETIGYNPSKTLDKNHGDSHPAVEVIQEGLNTLKNKKTTKNWTF